MPDEDEFTELVDADFPRVDLVGKGANGIPRFLIAKQAEASAGLLPAEYVRDLIAKAGPETAGRERVTMPSGVTLTGSPADIAAFIHKAALRAGSGEDGDGQDGVAKAKNDTADRKHKAATGAAMSDGSYPIANESDLTKAIHAVGRGGSSHNAIRKHIISRARSLGASSKIPDNWNSDGSLKGDSVSKTAAEPVAKGAGDMLDAQLDDGVDGMDPTVPLAAPEEDAPGDPTDPGSPAWEAIDAATAQKWTSILARARVAVDLLAEREMLEAASVDPDDAGNACDLQDVCCAIDFAISVLAPFAVSEQSEADCGTEAMAAIGKAMAADVSGPLAVVEGLAAVAKAGRVLSASNEAEIRSAAVSLNKVLASLPQAPVSDEVTKQKEAAVAATTQTAQDAAASAQVAKEDATPEAQAAAAGPVTAGGTTGMGEPRATGTDSALPGDGPQESRPGDVPGRQVVKGALQSAVYLRDGTVALVDPAAIAQQIAKADDGDDGKVTMQAVFDQHGNLVGVVDASAITPVAGAGAKPSDGEGEKPAEGAKASEDLSPAPAGDAGTPAEGMPGDDVSKQADESAPAAAKDPEGAREVLKSLVAELVTAELEGRAPAEDIAKQADVAGLGDLVETLKGRVAALEAQPAPPKVFAHGQVPPAHQLRGQDRTQGGAPPQVDVAKAAELKGQLYRGTPAEQNAAFGEMQKMAIDALAAVHGR